MAAIKLQFRGGGVTGFDKFRKNEEMFGKWSEVKEKGGYDLLTKSALKGVLCYLAGEIERVSEISDSDVDGAIESRKVEPIDTWFEFMTTRYKSTTAKNPNIIGFDELTLDDAKSGMVLCKSVIQKHFGTDNLSEIEKRNNIKNLPTVALSPVEIARAHTVLNLVKANLSGKFWKSVEKKLEDYTNWVPTPKGSPLVKGWMPDETLSVYEEIVNMAINNPAFEGEMNKSSLTFLPMTPQPKDYAGVSPSFGTSGVGYMQKSDFNVFLEVSSDLLERLKVGPGSAFWGHKGLVEWTEVLKDEIPVDAPRELSYSFPIKSTKKGKGKKK